ncbi:hypothetical protein MBSD_n1604 [Mizugakiibacter sediminis]|uniref:Uncharacterized protein n=1 Tax=Mizugakiibacter sediminis TaxID=1475481 RepID=A0A0K8QN20_9GAMM|nr:hypothetical protein [Mizugakiibacter sediminis]GAP66300.1 hypothetical protein MBSD_n1604 [Mizugakiibacter sediminis]
MTRRDYVTPDLFEVPRPAAPLPGSMDYRTTVCGLLSTMLEESGQSRFAIAAKVSELTGREVTKYMLDSYCAESREDYNAPAFIMPVIEVAAGSYVYSNWLASIRGGRLLVGRDALAAELGRVERMKEELAQQERAIKDQLRRGR